MDDGDEEKKSLIGRSARRRGGAREKKRGKRYAREILTPLMGPWVAIWEMERFYGYSLKIAKEDRWLIWSLNMACLGEGIGRYGR